MAITVITIITVAYCTTNLLDEDYEEKKEEEMMMDGETPPMMEVAMGMEVEGEKKME